MLLATTYDGCQHDKLRRTNYTCANKVAARARSPSMGAKPPCLRRRQATKTAPRSASLGATYNLLPGERLDCRAADMRRVVGGPSNMGRVQATENERPRQHNSVVLRTDNMQATRDRVCLQLPHKARSEGDRHAVSGPPVKETETSAQALKQCKRKATTQSGSATGKAVLVMQDASNHDRRTHLRPPSAHRQAN